MKPILNPGAAGKVENLRKAQIAGLSVMDVAAEVDKLAKARASSELPVTKALDAAWRALLAIDAAKRKDRKAFETLE